MRHKPGAEVTGILQKRSFDAAAFVLSLEVRKKAFNGLAYCAKAKNSITLDLCSSFQGSED